MWSNKHISQKKHLLIKSVRASDRVCRRHLVKIICKIMMTPAFGVMEINVLLILTLVEIEFLATILACDLRPILTWFWRGSSSSGSVAANLPPNSEKLFFSTKRYTSTYCKIEATESLWKLPTAKSPLLNACENYLGIANRYYWMPGARIQTHNLLIMSLLL